MYVCVFYLQVEDEERRKFDKFVATLSYVKGEYDKAEEYQKLNEKLRKLKGGQGPANRLFYLSLPPSLYETVTGQLRQHCMSEG